MDIAELIERLEKAEGADRRIDCLIENALGLAKFERDPKVGYGDADYTRVEPKLYTSSIDAAMTLMPEGYDWALYRTNDGITIHAQCGSNEHWFGETPAIALCIAALKAREQIAGA